MTTTGGGRKGVASGQPDRPSKSEGPGRKRTCLILELGFGV
jgi:hypothetical protein